METRTKNFIICSIATATVLGLAQPALATDVLTFEGLTNLQPVADAYAPKYSFSPATLAVVDADEGGTGNIANEPSGKTVMFFLDANAAILNVIDGFDTGFSFYYSSNTVASVTVFDGADGTGNILATLPLALQYNSGCTGDPTGDYCNWTSVGVSFLGVAKSINFSGAANFVAFDNITFGSSTPGTGSVPEPGAWAMMIAGFGMIGGAMRRRSTSLSFAA